MFPSSMAYVLSLPQADQDVSSVLIQQQTHAVNDVSVGPHAQRRASVGSNAVPKSLRASPVRGGGAKGPLLCGNGK